MSEEKLLGVLSGSTDRRRIIFGLAAALGGVAMGAMPVVTGADEISRTAETIHQEASFKANRKRVYDALTVTSQFDKVVSMGAAVRSGAKLGNAPTKVSPVTGAAFTIFGGHIIGRNLEMVPGQRIVQAWRVVDWEPGVFSVVKFDLLEDGSGCKIIFDHTGFPKGQAEHLAEGWKGNYWEPLQKFLA